jgi:hypothetical protein
VSNTKSSKPYSIRLSLEAEAVLKSIQPGLRSKIIDALIVSILPVALNKANAYEIICQDKLRDFLTLLISEKECSKISIEKEEVSVKKTNFREMW